MNKLTVFTPTYNRGYTLSRLADSLINQTNHQFDWLVIDDGSEDNTEEIIKEYQNMDLPFRITYQKVKNGGKQRAINLAVHQIKTEYIFIVDSDDYLTEDAIEKVSGWLADLPKEFAGLSGVKGKNGFKYISGMPLIEERYIDATNLERIKYNLMSDMAEIYKVDILKKYPFRVWDGETFVPESTVWNQIALDGYMLRWYKDIIYICEYLEDGLTKGSWQLLKKNPMGYAMMYNHQLLTEKTGRANIAIQMISCLCMGRKLSKIFKSNAPVLALLCVPVGVALYFRRKSQFRTT